MSKIPQKYSKNSYKNLHLFTDKNLQETLNFTDEDLEANRDGYTTKRQRKVILFQFWKHIRYVFVFSIGFIIFCLLTLWMVDIGIGRAGLFIGFLPFLIGTAWIIGWTRGGFRAVRTDLRKGNVETIRGQASKLSIYVMIIECIRFEMHEDIGVLFEDNTGYIIHYAPYSKMILSAEKMIPHAK